MVTKGSYGAGQPDSMSRGRAGESLMRQLEQLAAGWPADEQAKLAGELDRQQVTDANYSRANSLPAITGSQLRIFRGDEHEHQHGKM